MPTIGSVLKERAEKGSEEIAFSYLHGNGELVPISNEQLHRQANKLAGILLKHVDKGDRALMLYPPGLDFLVAFFACVYAGVIAIPSYPQRRNQKADRLLSIINDADVNLVLTVSSVGAEKQRSELESKANHIPGHWLETDLAILEPVSGKEIGCCQLPLVSEDDVAFLQYTSGSTGSPKGVVVSHGNIVHNESLVYHSFAHNKQTRMLSWLPHFHDMGLIGGILQPFYIGTPAVLMNPTDFIQKPVRWLKAISDHGITTSGGPSFAFDLCVDRIRDEEMEGVDLSGWSLAFMGAEPINDITVKRFTERFSKYGLQSNTIYPCYGLAEATLFVSGGAPQNKPITLPVNPQTLQHNRIETPTGTDKAQYLVSSGDYGTYSSVDHEILVVNKDDWYPCLQRQIGEIWIKGGSVAQGYWNKPEINEAIFDAYTKDGQGPYFKSGDLGFHDNGQLYITGRLKDLIIIRGRNHYPQDIERTVSRCHDALVPNSAAVFTIGDNDKKLVVAQELKRSHVRKVNLEDIFNEILSSVASEHELQLHDIVLLKPNSIYKTSSGKIQRQRSRQAYSDNEYRAVVGSYRRWIEQQTADNEGTLNQPANNTSPQQIEHWLIHQLAELLDRSPKSISRFSAFHELGVDSSSIVMLSERLSRLLGEEVSPTLAYDYPSINRVAEFLGGVPGEANECSENTPDKNLVENSTSDGLDTDDIAVIGMSCRLPGAKNLSELWQLLVNGKDAISMPDESRLRFETDLKSDRWGGYLNNIAEFDATFFGLTASETEYLDPQQRILLELSFEAISDAGYAADNLRGSEVGVFVGISSTDYGALCTERAGVSPYLGRGNALSIAANRISYFYDFKGPSVSVDTACSSSLVAFHQAHQSLRSGESSMAIVAGVNLLLKSEITESFAQADMLAEDGRCKVFDASADGYVRSEGAGVLVLKRLSQALKDGDSPVAVIKGSAVAQDGASNGLNAPNGLAQQAVIRKALRQLPSDEVCYVEAHGTGTKLGDPIELQALQQVYGEGRNEKTPLWVGSIKANVGHLESGAGIVGLLKTILCLKHQHLPPQIHLKELNPHVSWNDMALQIPLVNTALKPQDNKPLFMGVSSFGFGGTLGHVVLRSLTPDEYQVISLQHINGSASEVGNHSDAGNCLVLSLSAKTEKSRDALLQQYEHYLRENQEDQLVDICATAAFARTEFKHRVTIVGQTKDEMAQHIARFLAQGSHPDCIKGKSEKTQKIAFLFSGQGAQYPLMGCELYQTQPVFRDAIDRCATYLESSLAIPLTELLFVEKACEGKAHSRLDQTEFTQPALFALEYSLAKLWVSWGIEPACLVGHSIGEYVAACLADVFSLKEALILLSARGRLMQKVNKPGAMLAVAASRERVQSVLASHSKDNKRCDIAAINCPDQVVVSGDIDEISALKDYFTNESIKTRELDVSHAFHSSHMDEMLNDFEILAKTINFQIPKLPIYSNVTGERAGAEMATSGYWCKHIRQTVEFEKGVNSLYADAIASPEGQSGAQLVFLEIGPHPVLTGAAAKTLKGKGCRFVSSLEQGTSDRRHIMRSLGTLCCQGVSINWQGPLAMENSRFSLCRRAPVYAFQRQPYWFENQRIAQVPAKPAEQQPMLAEITESVAQHSETTQINAENSREEVDIFVRTKMSKFFKIDPEELDGELTLLEMGADSLVLVELVRQLEKHYGLEFSVKQFFNELNTINALVDYIDRETAGRRQASIAVSITNETIGANESLPTVEPEQLPKNSAAITQRGRSTPHLQPDLLSQLMKSQLDAATQVNNKESVQALQNVVAQQLAFIGVAPEAQIHQAKAQTIAPEPDSSSEEPEAVNRAEALPSWQAKPIHCSSMRASQKRHLQEFQQRYLAKTEKSKELMQKYRPHLADSRAVAGFRLSSKEMLYPLFADHARGARTWDVDGNEYIDITMGFGVNLFGHHPDFIVNTLSAQLHKTMQLGLQSPLAGEVAELFAELTEMERVAFCNTGTEAVMVALRLARTKTRRNQVVQFSNSYHGHFDGTLCEADGEGLTTRGVAPGVPKGIVNDAWVLAYDSPDALTIIEQNHQDIAAVIVEPIQSRCPHIQPKEFLHKLREVTQKYDIALIFDEMIMGFRLHQAGAQGFFGVRADMATYGKIVGGGLPIGVVAGASVYLDGIDGGMWQYGDDSYPQSETTFFAGTFGKHPLTMATAHAVLSEIKRQGPQLQETLNRRTQNMADQLNRYFQEHSVDIKIVVAGSLFRFAYQQNLDLLFYHLMEKGIYVWEGRNCFLSTAHTEEDIATIIKAVKESVQALISGGYLSSAKTSQSLLTNPQEKPENDNSAPAGIFPLGEAQRQLWLLNEQNNNGGLAYHLPLNVRLKGDVNVSALKLAAHAIIARHESLRTVVLNDEQAIQTVNPVPEQIDWEMHHLSSLEDSAANSATTLIKEWVGQKFDLHKDLLIRFLLIKYDSENWSLSLVAHHICMDAVSMAIILNELDQLYSRATALNNGTWNAEQAIKLAQCLPAPMQYRDYLSLQEYLGSTPGYTEQQAFWAKQLNDLPEPMLLPGDRPRPAIKTYHGGCDVRWLDQEVCELIVKAARKRGCTPFMMFFSIYALWLHRLSGNDDILLGTPVTGRNLIDTALKDAANKSEMAQSDEHSLVGYCTHVLPIRSTIGEPLTFDAFLSQTREHLLLAYDHQDLPFAQMMQELKTVGDRKTSALLNTVFNLDRVTETMQLGSMPVSWMEPTIEYCHFDFAFHLTDMQGSWLLECNFNRDLFNAETVTQYLNYFENLLRNVAKSVSEESPVMIEQLTFLPEGEEVLPCHGKQNSNGRDRIIVEVIEDQAKLTPAAIAVQFSQQQLNYQTLNAKANRLCNYLVENGYGQGDYIGVSMPREPGLLIALLAIMKSGAAYVPLGPQQGEQRLQKIIQQADISLVLVHSSLSEQLPVAGVDVLEIDTDILQDDWFDAYQETNSSSNLANGNHSAYVIFTSGSTGVPKGVEVSHASLADYCAFALENYYQTGDSSTSALKGSLVLSPHSFDLSIPGLFLPLMSGDRVWLLDEDDAINELALLCRQADSSGYLIRATPSHIKLLLDALSLDSEQQSIVQQHVFVIGGEPFSTSLVSALSATFPKADIYNHYGPTEAIIGCTLFPYRVSQVLNPLAEHGEQVPIGLPMENTQISIVDKNQQPVATGLAGELYVGSPWLAKGYINDPEQTALAFSGEGEKRRYRTGDRVRWLINAKGEPAALQFLGRVDDQIKLRGFRIELNEINSQLKALDGISDGLVLLHTGGGQTDNLVAYAATDKGLTSAAVKTQLASALPDYMVPAHVLLLKALPTNAHGKVDRQALLTLPLDDSGDGQGAHVNVTPPRNTQEQLLLDVFTQVLRGTKQSSTTQSGKESRPLGVFDHFMDAGGDSILSLQVVSRARRAGFSFKVKDLFAHPTVAALSGFIDSQLSEKSVQDSRAIVQQPQNQSNQNTVQKFLKSAPLNAIQTWFFQQGFHEPEHFNQAVLLNCKKSLSSKNLNAALNVLRSHHDALRLNFRKQANSWQSFDSQVEVLNVDCEDFSTLTDASDLAERITNCCQLAQKSLSFTKSAAEDITSEYSHSKTNPLFKAVHMLLPSNQAQNRLFLVAHHLIIDGVSWRTLLEDLVLILEQETAGKSLIPDAGTGFLDYARLMQDCAVTSKVQAEVPYWQASVKSAQAGLISLESDEQVGLEREAKIISVSLDKLTTESLLGPARRTYGSEINELLLAALGLALNSWEPTVSQRFTIMLEGHGREEFHSDLQIERTVGWFTSKYPVTLNVNEDELANHILQTQALLRSVPEHGVGYGILRYLHPDASIRESLSLNEKALLLFNYLGQFDPLFDGQDSLSPATENPGHMSGLDNERRCLMEVTAQVVHHQLKIEFSYSANHYSDPEIADLSSKYQGFLEQITSHCIQHDVLDFDHKAKDTSSHVFEPTTWPLSPMQEGMLFHGLVDENEDAYVGQIHCEIKSRLNVECLEQAWQLLVEQHSILRTALVSAQSEDIDISGTQQPYVQQLQSSLHSYFEYIDWQGRSDNEQREGFITLCATELEKGIATDIAPLMRIKLVQMNEQGFGLLWTRHHLITDGWSTQRLFARLMQIYQTLTDGQVPASYADNYSDYIQFIAEYNRQEGCQYWQHYLEGFSSPLNIDLAKPDGLSTQSGHEIQSLSLSAQQQAQLNMFARRHHLTQATVVQGAWALALQLYCQQNDVVFGVTVSGRPAELEAVEERVGLYINTLPLRVKVEVGASLIQWCQDLQTQQLECQEFQFNSLTEIQRISDVEAGQGLFDSVLVFENYPLSDLEESSSSSQAVKLENITSRERTHYGLTLVVTQGAQLKLELAYSSKDYDGDAVAQLLTRLVSTIAMMTDGTRETIREVQAISSDEQTRLLELANGQVKKLTFANITQSLLQQTPDNLAVSCEGQTLSYRELVQKASKLASVLIQESEANENISQDQQSLVAVCLPRSTDLSIAITATLLSGLVYLPLDTKAPVARIEQLIRESGVQFVIGDADLQNRLLKAAPHLDIKFLCVNDPELWAVDAASILPKVPAQQLAYTIYTSGSTGKPKGVMIEHRSLVNLADYLKNTLQIEPGQRWALNAAITFDASLQGISLLCYGCSLFWVPERLRTEPSELVAFLENEQIDYLDCTPGQLSALMPWLKSAKLVKGFSLIVGGEAISPEQWLDLVQIQEEKGHRAWNAYGPTECCVDACFTRIEGRQPSIGGPVQNTQTWVLDAEQNLLPQGVAGELYIGGDGLARAYHNQLAHTKERFIEHSFGTAVKHRLYRTGDRVRWLGNGSLAYLGRVDDQIKIRGHRIEPAEIQQALRFMDNVEDACVLLQASENTQQLIAFITTTNRKVSGADNRLLKADQLRVKLATLLPAYMLPAEVVELAAFPLNRNLKVDKPALIEIYNALIGESTNKITEGSREAITETEQHILDIFAQVLSKQTALHPDDSFLALGGDSILSMQVANLMRQAGLPIRVKDIFIHQSARALARICDAQSENDDVGEYPDIHRVEPEQGEITGQFALGPIFHWFKEQQFSVPGHWNQSVLLDADKTAVNEHSVLAALKHLYAHHDILRARFESAGLTSETGGYAAIDEANVSFQVLKTNTTERISSHCQCWQNGFVLENGGLLNVVLILTPEKEAVNKLFICAHHWLVDGMSWRILLEDLVTLIASSDQEAAALPPKTASYRQYVQSLVGLVQKGNFDHELGYWQEQANMGRSHSVFNEANFGLEAEQRDLSFYLTAQQTQSLLVDANQAYGTHLVELLVTSVLMGLRSWLADSSGANLARLPEAISFLMEGHGRSLRDVGLWGTSNEDLPDLSRTVGWFTALYPMCFSLNNATHEGISDYLKLTKDNMRRVPNGGLAYSALRYLDSEESVRSSLQMPTRADVLFNYLGQFEQSENSILQLADTDLNENLPIMDRAAENHRPAALTINAMVKPVLNGEHGKQLHIDIGYSSVMFAEPEIQYLVDVVKLSLNALLDHCLQTGSRKVSCVDFPLLVPVHHIHWKHLEKAVYEPVARAHKSSQIENIFPLAPVQSGMLMHTLRAPKSSAYQQLLSCEFHTQIDPDAFLLAWQRVIQKHSVMRTGFCHEGLSEPVQYVLDKLSPETFFQFHDFTKLETKLNEPGAGHKDSASQRFQALLEEQEALGFTLQNAPALRLHLVKFDAARFGLIWVQHHILFDGWSLAVVLQEFFDNYRRVIADDVKEDIQPEHYADFVAFLQKQNLTHARQFWSEYLSGMSEPTAIPFSALKNSSISTTQEDSGKELTHRDTSLLASNALVSKLNDFARSHSLTLTTLMQGAWALLLRRYAQSEDVVFGVTSSGRSVDLPDIEQRVGLFINTLPVRVNCDPKKTKIEWLKSLQEDFARLTEFSSTSLTDIQSNTDVSAQLGLFDTVIVVENYPLSNEVETAQADLAVRNLNINIHNHYPLTLNVKLASGHSSELQDADSPAQIALKLNYDARIYSKAEVDTLAESFLAILSTIITTDEVTDDNRLLPHEQRIIEQAQGEIQHGGRSLSVLSLFEQQALSSPDAIAIRYEETTLSYEQLDALSNRLAHYLLELGYGSGDVIGVYLQPSLKLMPTLLAIWKIGAAYAPLDISQTEARLSFMVDSAGLECVLISDALIERMPLKNVDLVVLDDLLSFPSDGNSEFESVNKPKRFAESELLSASAYVIFTSGSTGRPKGVEVSHAGLIDYCAAALTQYYSNELSGAVLASSHCFDLSVPALYLPLTRGDTLELLPEGQMLSQLLQRFSLAETSPYLFRMTPSLCQAMLDELDVASDSSHATSGFERAQAHSFVIGGESLSTEQATALQKCFPNASIYNHYGPSEAIVGCCMHKFDVSAVTMQNQVPIGRGLQNVVLHVLDKEMRQVPVAVPGELYIGGPGLAKGYLSQPELTAERFIDLPDGRAYRTGDLVCYQLDGELQYLGRSDDQVKIRGFRVELGEIERQLEQLDLVHTCHVLLRKNADPDPQRVLTAYVVLKAGYLTELEEVDGDARTESEDIMVSSAVLEIKKQLSLRLPDYMLPLAYSILETLPLNSNGKVDKDKLLAMTTLRTGSQRYEAPRNDIEQKLTQIFVQVLGQCLPDKKLSIHDNFFDLGGHSLMVMRLVSLIRSEFDVEVSFQAIFDHPTVASFASWFALLLSRRSLEANESDELVEDGVI